MVLSLKILKFWTFKLAKNTKEPILYGTEKAQKYVSVEKKETMPKKACFSLCKNANNFLCVLT